MKDFNHVQTVLQCELDKWFKKQACDPHTRYYLYYMASTPEHNSGLLICKNKPANPSYKLASPEAINGYTTVSKNHYKFSEILGSLPVLDN